MTQRGKLLEIAMYLLAESDDDHWVKTSDIIRHLNALGIGANSKTVHADIRCLQDEFGMNIIQEGNTSSRTYHVAEFIFQLEELQFLVDCVSESNFLTQKKSSELVKKLSMFTSRANGVKLQRTLYLRNRIKNMDESVYRIVHDLSNAINSNRQIHFQYFNYDMYKHRVLSRDGAIYTVSPFALLYVDQNYYLLGYSQDAKEFRHYRVDRITSVTIAPTAREGGDEFQELDMATYTRKVFYMFTGEEKEVCCRFQSNLVRPVLDRFGKDTRLIPDDADHFTVHLDVAVSPQFYAWMSAYGDEAEIISPYEVRQGYIDHLKSILKVYEGEIRKASEQQS